MKTKKTATRGALQTPYPTKDGGLTYPIKWEDGEGPVSIRGTGNAYAEGRMVRLINGKVMSLEGIILG